MEENNGRNNAENKSNNNNFPNASKKPNSNDQGEKNSTQNNFPNNKDKVLTTKFPIKSNITSEFDFRQRSSSIRLTPRLRMESINENEVQPSASPPISSVSSSPSSLNDEMKNMDEVMKNLKQRRKSLQTMVENRCISPTLEVRKYRRSSSHVPTITVYNAGDIDINENSSHHRRASEASKPSETFELSPEMLANLHGKRRRSMQRLMSYFPNESIQSGNENLSNNRRSSQVSRPSQTLDLSPEMLSQLRGGRRRSMQRLMGHFPSESLSGDPNNFRRRTTSLFDSSTVKSVGQRLTDFRNSRDHRKSSQTSGGILDNSLERVFDLRNSRRRSSQISNLEDIREYSENYEIKDEHQNNIRKKSDVEANYGALNEKSEKNKEHDFKQLAEIKIVKVQVENESNNQEAETPLLSPNNIQIPVQHLNTTNNNNNIIQNHHRKNSSNLAVRRRSSISHQDGGTTITQSTTYATPDNKFFEETVETFCFVDDDSNCSISTIDSNTNNNYNSFNNNNNNNNIDNNNIKMPPKLDAVSKITGQWGKWQLRTVLLIFLCKIPSSWFMACIIFTAPAPRHGEFYCKPPETIDTTNYTKWIKISHPEKEEADDQEFNIDFCNVYQDAKAHAHEYFHYDSQNSEPRPWEQPEKSTSVIPCDAFEHKAEYNSLITQFDLVCSRDILVAVTQFFHLFGVLTGGILATHLLQHFSPKNVMLFGMLTQIFCGVMTGHVTSYELHVFFRCLSAVCCAQMYTAGSMIFTDITGGKYRTTCVCLFEQFWSIGVILLPLVSSLFKSWTHIYMAISFPTMILVYLWKWIPDSPRWLLQRGRLHEARDILIQCIEINGTQDSLPLDIDHQLKQQSIDLINAPSPPGWWTIWKGERAILHMICVHLAWSIYIVVYYGMLLNIRAFSREHLEINTVIAGCSEIIGTFIGLFLILNTSIKWQATGLFNIVAGCIAYSAWVIPPEIKGNPRVALLMLSAMVSKAAISCTLSILTTCTTELVGDEKKKICAYSTIVWARIWLLTAPFVGATIVFGQLIPQTCFGTLAIIGGIITTCINGPRTIPKQSSDTKLSKTKLNSNLPPELSPGIWTIKHHDEKYHI